MKNLIKIALFLNSERGLAVYSHLRKKKNISIQAIFVAKKNLDRKFLFRLRKKRIKFYLIRNVNNLSVKKALKQSDLGVSAGFPYIFKKDLLQMNQYGILNCHAGLLPKYRGGSPLNWQIINDEKYFGLTVIKITNGIDTGDIVLEKKIRLLKKYDINDLHRIANKTFPQMVYLSVTRLLKRVKLKKQNNNKSNCFKQRNKEDSKIDLFSNSFKKIKLYLRALKPPYPKPFFIFKNKKITINGVKITNLKLRTDKIQKIKGKLYVKCKDKVLAIN